MEGFDDFENFIRTFVIDDGGCDTQYEQPYRQTDLGKSLMRFGVSWKTAEQYKAFVGTSYVIMHIISYFTKPSKDFARFKMSSRLQING